MPYPRLVVGDGHLGILGALPNVYPDAPEERCWYHKLLNVLDKLARTRHEAKSRCCVRSLAPRRTASLNDMSPVRRVVSQERHPVAAETLTRDFERMVTFYQFPRKHWMHLQTTNIVESPLAALRLRTDVAKRYKHVDRATAVIWNILMVAAAVPTAERVGTAQAGLHRRRERGWDRDHPEGGRRLIQLHTY